ncbi:MAG: hypothetical protein QOJ65_333 [Fimbriimonadaceae bacterium]|jgi:hypothetical protein|nr:hypothetical protein [Fimbriimonadaceae bacterium]
MAKLDLSKFEAPPEPEVLRELEMMHAPVDKLIAEAVKFLDGSEEQDLAVARYFIEKGYSEKVAGWLVREANTRRAVTG